MLPRPLAHVPSLAPYAPGKPIEEVQREYGLDSVIKLASNENPLGPSPRALKAMRAVASEMNLYPDGNGFYLREALARRTGLSADRIVLGSGSNEITDLIALAYLGRNHNVVVSQYDFIGYALSARKVAAAVREVPLRAWRPDVRGLVRAIDSRTKLLCLANPGNPVGSMVTRSELEMLLARVPPRVMILLDEAYFEYVDAPDYPDGLRYVEDYPNLVVTRTFSKAYGLAGLRIGYGFAHPEVVRNLDRVRLPFNTNRMAQAAALAALDDSAHLRRSVRVNRQGRVALEGALRRLGLEWVPSVTNFVLIDTARSGVEVCESLLRQGVIVRPMGGYGLPRHVRVTIGLPSENRRFVAALKKTLCEVEPLR